MSKVPLVIVSTIKRMVAYVLALIALGILAHRLKWDGEESYLLNALLVLAPLMIAEYRAARAELLLARAIEAHQPASTKQRPASPPQVSATLQSLPPRPARELGPSGLSNERVGSAKIEGQRAKFTFSGVLLVRITIVILILLSALYFYISKW